MAKSLLEEEVEVYSEKYDIHGVVRDYGMVTKKTPHIYFTSSKTGLTNTDVKRILKLLTK